jgi:C1A family cysteine protease
MESEPVDFINIIKEVDKQNTWKATEYDFMKLPRSELTKFLGVIPDYEDLKRIRAKPKPDIVRVIADFRGAKSKDGLYFLNENFLDIIRDLVVERPPVVVDWRNRRDKNNVTSVKNQGGCGSCVSFASIAALESMLIIEHNVSLDLSEAELLFCGGGSCGGWWPSNAVTYLRNNGVSQETCFPYVATNMPCSSCSERNGQAIQITYSVELSNMNDRKNFLSTCGPTICVFEVFQDFFSYSSGVYSHVTGSSVGLHSVEVIGYDNGLNCWICKNSWGSGWGDGGFFKIAYGQCSIDSAFPFWLIGHTRWYSFG